MTDPTDSLVHGVENYLAALPAREFDALVAKVRDPEDEKNRDYARKLFGGRK